MESPVPAVTLALGEWRLRLRATSHGVRDLLSDKDQATELSAQGARVLFSPPTVFHLAFPKTHTYVLHTRSFTNE